MKKILFVLSMLCASTAFAYDYSYNRPPPHYGGHRAPYENHYEGHRHHNSFYLYYDFRPYFGGYYRPYQPNPNWECRWNAYGNGDCWIRNRW